jgi:cold shock protein
MQGTCKEFDINKGYGTITGEDGKSYFCHFSAIQSNAISLDPDDAVTFTPAEGARGKTATMVTLI